MVDNAYDESIAANSIFNLDDHDWGTAMEGKWYGDPQRKLPVKDGAPAPEVPVFTPPSPEPASVTPSAAAPSVYEPPASSVDSITKDPTKGLLSSSVEDINVLTDPSGDLMRGADTRAKQIMNERGLLNTSMTAGAIEAERLKEVMPLVEQTAGVRGDILTQEERQDWTSGENALARSHDVTMLLAEGDQKAQLINLEQEWNELIQTNINVASFWQTTMDEVGDILGDPDSTNEQKEAAMDYMLGNPATGEIGILTPGLNFMRDLETL